MPDQVNKVNNQVTQKHFILGNLKKKKKCNSKVKQMVFYLAHKSCQIIISKEYHKYSKILLSTFNQY